MADQHPAPAPICSTSRPRCRWRGTGRSQPRRPPRPGPGRCPATADWPPCTRPAGREHPPVAPGDSAAPGGPPDRPVRLTTLAWRLASPGRAQREPADHADHQGTAAPMTTSATSHRDQPRPPRARCRPPGRRLCASPLPALTWSKVRSTPPPRNHHVATPTTARATTVNSSGPVPLPPAPSPAARSRSRRG